MRKTLSVALLFTFSSLQALAAESNAPAASANAPAASAAAPAAATPAPTPAAPAPAAAAKGRSCEAVKTEIAAKLDAKGVKNYTLAVVAPDQVGGARVVGSCEGGSKRITYARK